MKDNSHPLEGELFTSRALSLSLLPAGGTQITLCCESLLQTEETSEKDALSDTVLRLSSGCLQRHGLLLSSSHCFWSQSEYGLQSGDCLSVVEAPLGVPPRLMLVHLATSCTSFRNPPRSPCRHGVCWMRHDDYRSFLRSDEKTCSSRNSTL
ncbi:hypothetical protein ILYODFUR_027495 [Ilyodon furcidens]|uniref:Uncharacterized protein n=1 Tax=Ilyodon furcidens TaxID=33524 RepID=A0ABV0T131_9TELE